MVKASVFFENQIYLKTLDFLERCKQFIAHSPQKLEDIFSGLQNSQPLRVLLPICYAGIKGFVGFKGYVSFKLSPFSNYLARHFHKFQYWLINPGQVRSNGGVAIFSYDSKDARKIFIFVALVHAIVFLLFFSFSELHRSKIPDLMIELGGAPQASNGLSQSPGEQTSPNPVKDAPKAAPIAENVDTELIKERELKRLEKKKELELERERQKEIEREKQKQKEKERELNLERVKELERDRQRARELEQERKRELERERQRARELDQEKKKEQERQRQKEVQEQKQREKQLEQQQKQQKEKLPEPKKLDKDGTVPPPPSPAAPATPAVPSTPVPSAPASPPPSSMPPASSSAASSASPTSGGASASGSSGSMSASISNAPASAPTLDAEPKALTQSNPKPAYPLLAFKMKIQGKVLLIVDVAESGAVNKVTLAESSGNESLDRSALDAVKNWKFTPARKNGVIVSQVIKVPITFSLKNR